MYADYDFYTNEYYGDTLTEDIYPKYATRAADFIDYYTMEKAARVVDAGTDTKTITKIQKASCAVADQLYIVDMEAQAAKNAMQSVLAGQAESGTGEIKSESVGGWSQTYVTSSEYASASSSIRDKETAQCIKAATKYLASTGLLYRGARLVYDKPYIYEHPEAFWPCNYGSRI